MRNLLKLSAILGAFSILFTGCGSTDSNATEKDTANETAETSEVSASTEGALPDGTYLASALTTHYAANCLAGVDYDSLFDIQFTVEDGVFTAIQFDIGTNAKAVPETAEVSMEDWPFIKLSEVQANQNLIGKPATEDAVLTAWQIEKREELLEQDIDVTSGATEACRAARDAIINVITMQENGDTATTAVYVKDILPNMNLFTGTITGEKELENGRTSKTVQIDDGDYVLYGIVSANNNEIDNEVVDYNYILEVDVSVSDGNIKSISCQTPNGSDASKEAVAEAEEIAKDKLEGKAATNETIQQNLPYDAENDAAFSGSTEAKIACDMISNVLQNGCTHIVGWSY